MKTRLPSRLRFLSAFAVFSSVFAAGCIQRDIVIEERPARVDGRIILDLVQPINTHNPFVVVPSRRSITRLTGGVTLPKVDAADPTARVEGCSLRPVAYSPDRKFLATCTGDVLATMIGAKPDQFAIAKVSSAAVECRGLKGRAIGGFLWSPDSKAVAVLAYDTRVSLNPRYWFYALSGHPVQFETYYLNIVDTATLAVTSYRIPLETSGGSAALLKWE